jgi:glyoxylase-like metal-dependent hydrolase (beta-lactamase superfamily II)
MWAAPDQDLGGIRRLELPLPFPPGSVNVYLAPAEDGWILVDCGIDIPRALSAYALEGVDFQDIRQILLTHVHPDHSGLSARIRDRSRAPLRMHRNEQEVLWELRDAERWMDWQDCILTGAGVPRETRTEIRDATRELRSFYSAVEADSYIEDREVISTAAGPMHAILSPGHSPGHLCFYFPEKRILLGGDQLLRPSSPHLDWHPSGFALNEFRASLTALRGLDVDWVLPSHGRAYSGHRNRVDALLEHSRDLDLRIAALLAEGVCTPQGLASAIWRMPLPAFEHRNAVFEVLAYLQQPKYWGFHISYGQRKSGLLYPPDMGSR